MLDVSFLLVYNTHIKARGKDKEMNNKWEPTKRELEAEKWLTDNGFVITDRKHYLSKTQYNVTKDDIFDLFELPSAVTNIPLYMKMYGESWAMLKILRGKENHD